MNRYKALLAALLAWSLAVTLYAAVLSYRVAELSQSLAEAKELLANTTRALRSLEDSVRRLGNITGGISVVVEIRPPGERRSVTLWSGATVLDALSSVADIHLKDGRIHGVDGVEGGWSVYVVRGGERIRVEHPGSFQVADGDLVVACRDC